MRKPSNTCVEDIKREEALRLFAYRDFKGVWTIGYGSTRGVYEGMEISEAEALVRLEQDIADAIQTIYRHVPAEVIDALPQLCFDALVSFIFNVGAQAFKNPRTGARTDFYRAITGRDLAEVARQMQRWVYSGKRIAPGLVKRRGREAAMWGEGLLELQHGEDVQVSGIESGPLPPALDENATPDPPRAEPITKQPVGVGGIAAGAGGAGALAKEVMDAAGVTKSMSTDSVILSVLGVVLTVLAIGLLGYAAWRRYRRR